MRKRNRIMYSKMEGDLGGCGSSMKRRLVFDKELENQVVGYKLELSHDFEISYQAKVMRFRDLMPSTSNFSLESVSDVLKHLLEKEENEKYDFKNRNVKNNDKYALFKKENAMYRAHAYTTGIEKLIEHYYHKKFNEKPKPKN